MMLLDGIRVVELPGSVATSFCGKLLADAGADVIKVEPPEGDALRRRAIDGDVQAEALFATINTSKSSRVIESTAAGRQALDDVIASADLLLMGPSAAGSTAETSGTSETSDDWLARFPALVVTQVTPFGIAGPRASWASSDLVQYAMTCWLHITGRPDREPLSVGGNFAATVPGLCAASASLMALWARDATGLGQVVDVSQQEALTLCQPYLDVGFSYTGVDRHRNGMPFPMTIVPAADGYLGVNVLTQTQWELLCAYTGRVGLIDDPRLVDPAHRLEHTAELTKIFSEWAADKDRVDVFREGQEWRIPFGYVPQIAEVPEMDQHVHRRFFAEVPHASGERIAVPGVPFLVDGERCRVAPAPALGAMSCDRSAASSSLPASSTSAKPADGSSSAAGPLTGLRVVDLSMFWSGPLAAGLLAQYGADVVKVESIQRVDGWRGMAADPSIEKSNLFNGVNLNKAGITLDLTSERGRALLRPLVESADVLIENFSPRVMSNFGLSDDVLYGWNPQLTILSMPAFGLTGPWRDFVGFAPTIEQLSGLPELTGYAGGPPALTGNSIADPCAGLVGCFALLATLRHRRRTGPGAPGAHIDLSQLEALTSLIGADIVEQQLSGATTERRGNESRTMAPYGCYPCRDSDTWIVISVVDDVAWRSLCDAAGSDWFCDDRFADTGSRRRHAAALDAAIAEWTQQHQHVELAQRLQDRGVAAAPVLWPSQLHDDGHLAARGSSQQLEREHVGSHRYPVLPFKFSGTPGSVHGAGPTLGQDNDRVLGGELGLTATQLDDLRAEQVIGEALPD